MHQRNSAHHRATDKTDRNANNRASLIFPRTEMLKMIDIQETLIAFSDLPGWCQKNLGRRVAPSTCHRWRLRGCRGVKLETLLIGGTRTTSAEALQRFFSATTRMQDGHASAEPQAIHIPQVSGESGATLGHDESVSFLRDQGI